MAYKRTTRKTGSGSRSTTTYNTKTNSITQSYSSKPKGWNHRYTQSFSGGAMKVTDTYTDPSGYITRTTRTLSETKAQARKRAVQARKNAKIAKDFWTSIFTLFKLLFGWMFRR